MVQGRFGSPVDGSAHRWHCRGVVRGYAKTASDGGGHVKLRLSSSKSPISAVGVAGVERSEPPENAADWGLTSFDPSHPSRNLELLRGLVEQLR